jgi:hypothetical protein
MRTTPLSKLAGGLTAVAAAIPLLHSPAALAGATIGFDPAGTSSYTDTQHWQDLTDSALAIGYLPLQPTPYDFQTLFQTAVGGMFDSGGTNVTPGILNPTQNNIDNGLCDLTTCYQLTKVVNYNERVTSFSSTVDASGNTIETASFGLGAQTADIDPNNQGNQQFLLYIDPLTTTATYDPNGATGYTTGTPIMGAHVIANTASFTTTIDTSGNATGTGSFTTTFQIDWVNSAYLDLAVGSIFTDTIQGNTNYPQDAYFPTVMWDGTDVSNGLLLRVDSSQDFGKTTIPEPASIALMGVGLLGASFTRRLRRSPRVSS